MTRRKKVLLVLAVSILCSYGIFTAYKVVIVLGMFPTTFLEHVAPDKVKVFELPKNATDVCYYETFRILAFEFSVSESDFLEWAKSNGWTIEAIDEEAPRTIGRYLIHRGTSDPDHQAKITRGYFYEYIFEVAYDKDKQRAYYFNYND